MSHHGSRQVSNEIKYRPQNPKLINRIWEDITGDEFRPDPRVPLPDLVIKRIDKTAYREQTEIVKSISPREEICYQLVDGLVVSIPKNFNPLIPLALANGYTFFTHDRKAYVAKAPRTSA